jgi:hypothetical protein
MRTSHRFELDRGPVYEATKRGRHHRNVVRGGVLVHLLDDLGRGREASLATRGYSTGDALKQPLSRHVVGDAFAGAERSLGHLLLLLDGLAEWGDSVASRSARRSLSGRR